MYDNINIMFDYHIIEEQNRIFKASTEISDYAYFSVGFNRCDLKVINAIIVNVMDLTQILYHEL